jgi:hypothetical protein
MSHRPRNQKEQRLAHELADAEGIPYTEALARIRAVAAANKRLSGAPTLPTILSWHDVTWKQFVAALAGYKSSFSQQSNEDYAYLSCASALEGMSMSERALRARDIVDFLNQWGCRVRRVDSAYMLYAWIREHTNRLEALATTRLLEDGAQTSAGEVAWLYAELMGAGKATVHNWSDAATSKALHQLLPQLVVMWDRNIKQFAPNYGDFTLAMHAFARRLAALAPVPADELEGHLQRELGYQSRKTLAKYLDEFNWYVMVGARQRAA